MEYYVLRATAGGEGTLEACCSGGGEAKQGGLRCNWVCPSDPEQPDGVRRPG